MFCDGHKNFDLISIYTKILRLWLSYTCKLKIKKKQVMQIINK